MQSQEIYSEAERILRLTYGDNASFRDGQYEAIEAVMTQKRNLIVQRTGWGKSLVYFICTKLFRNKGKGVTVVISPLLELMNDQKRQADSMNIKCDILNSKTKDRRQDIINSLINDELDLILVTPETLFSQDVEDCITKIRIGLLVIDEAHCISDWGHDFRLEYGKLHRIISSMPPNVSILAVTATANDRIVQDLKAQLGDEVFVSRGKLTRKSLHIQVLWMWSKRQRYAFILENLDKLPGSGIIYCLTRRECEELADFLNINGLNVMTYYSKDASGEASNDEAIKKFSANEIKALIATIKLGMGYDKGDISFIIHYQSPANIVTYYQQIGRAGRNIKDAYIFLMTSIEDDVINEYFIDTAFPTIKESSTVREIIAKHNGLKFNEILSSANLSQSRLKKALMFLENEEMIYKLDNLYYASSKNFFYNEEYYDAITQTRRLEMEKMHEFTQTDECLSKFIVNCLDDPETEDCGRCANCLNDDIYPGLSISSGSLDAASRYIDSRFLEIEPRKKWPDMKNIKFINMKGICLSKYGEVEIGFIVKNCKLQQKNFPDKVIARAAEVIYPLITEHDIKYLTFVPSLRSNIVKNFAYRIAEVLNIECLDLLMKTQAEPQKIMQNNFYQCENAKNSFSFRKIDIPDKIILIDDIVDSRWTLTVCGYKLMELGCKEVYPFALADSSEHE